MPGTFWNVSATNEKSGERFVHSGSREECELLLGLKLEEWGKRAKAHVEWSEHPHSQ